MSKKLKVATLWFVLFCFCICGKIAYASSVEDVQTHIITGFKENAVPVYELTVSSKGSEEEMAKKMPTTLSVYLDGEKTLTKIPVTWYCIEEDYATSEDYYFQFNPKWDSQKYQLAEGIDVLADSPYVAVFIKSISTFSVQDNIEEIFDFMVEEMDLNAAAACGVLANIEKESAFNPKATGDYGTSYGICQWHNERKSNLISWCNSNGYNYQTLSGQLHYLQYELSMNNYKVLYNGKTIYDKISSVSNSAQGAYDAAYAWCYYYEVPASKASVSVTRGNLARNTYWPTYGNRIVKYSVAVSSNESVYQTGSTVTLTYTTVSKATSYELSLYKDGKEVQTETVSGTQVELKSLGKGSYKAYITANIGNEAVTSEAFEFTVIDKPATPVLSSVKNSDSGITLTWKKVAGVDGYYVYHKSGNGSYSRIGTITNNATVSYLDTKVSAGVTYTYTVIAYKSSINSSYDKAGKSIVRLSKPSISRSNSSSGVTLSWNKIAGSKGYSIDKKTGSGSWKTAVQKTTSLSWTDKNVSNGTQYTYRVRAYNGSSYSAYSTSVAMVRLTTPSVTALSNSSKKTMKVTWAKNSKATGYEIQYATSSRFSSAKKVKVTSYKTTTKNISSLTKGKKYYVRVRSYKVVNGKTYYSVWSSAKSVTIKK